MNISLKCPVCKKEIAIPSRPGVEGKDAECAHCHTVQKVADYLPKLSLKVGQQNYQLHFGRQWIGRKSDNSDAQVQIPDESRYMSRMHAIIEVTCQTDGLQVTFEEHGKNPTTLQGIPLEKDDIVYLNQNDCLQLGDRKMYLAYEYQD